MLLIAGLGFGRYVGASATKPADASPLLSEKELERVEMMLKDGSSP